MARHALALFGLLLPLIACQGGKHRPLTDCFGDDIDLSLPDAVDSGALGLVSIDKATHIAVASGDWSDACVWDGGVLPEDGARVVIPEGIAIEETALSIQTSAPSEFTASCPSRLMWIPSFWLTPLSVRWAVSSKWERRVSPSLAR